LDQLAGIELQTVGFILIMATIVVVYSWWFDKKPVEFKRRHHKRVTGIFIGVVGGVSYLFFPSDKNMVLLMLGAVLLYLVNSRLVHYCAVCGRTIKTNMLKQVPEQCPYCRSLYSPPGKFD
jgi:rubrerythrin